MSSPAAQNESPAGPAAASRQRLKELALWTLKPLLLLAGGAAYLLMRLLEPWRLIRVGLLNYDRIGHLALNTESYLRARAAEPERRREVSIMFSGTPANRQLLTMIQRRLFATESTTLLRFYKHGLLPFVKGTRFHQIFPYWGGEYASFNAAGPQLSFLPEEERRGQRLLAEMGIPEGAPFVCFHARDKAYLDVMHSHNSREEWSGHDYRDCDIANYLPAAEALAAMGIYALRMGSVVEKRVSPRHPKVIDYATRFRSDFGDMYLLAHCKFYIGNTAGAVCVPPCFNVPTAAANYSPLGYALWRPGDIFIPKKYRDTASGRLATFSELVEKGIDRWQDDKLFRNAGLEVVENSAEEVLGLTKEMNSRLDGTWDPQADDDELQRRYRALFPTGHQITGYPSRVGADFLRRNRVLLD
ncbi:MAG: TIGR04372 family glycosyltransferase [Elusimicrobia bacterium]|nr:TIGR04372 family glycosyltransferase [Elusimicrobiota bacterium]